MNSERFIQAAIRFLMVGAGALVATFAANTTILVESVDDPILASVVGSLLTAGIAFVQKFLGGITQAPVTTDGVRAGDRKGVDRPNALAI